MWESMGVVVTCDSIHVKAREQFVRASFFLPPYSPDDQTQIIMLSSMHLYPLSYLTGPKPSFIESTSYVFIHTV